MKRILSLLSLMAALQTIAQPYTVKNGKTRHRFAQLEVGVTQYFAPKAGESQTLENGAVKNIQYGNKSTTAIFIGGTHFWGHADFALTIPIASIGDGMKYGVDLQAKYYPWRIEKNKLRPYVGISMNPFSYQQNDGPKVSKTYFPLMAGFNFMKGNNQFELGAVFNYKRDFNYAISRTQLGIAKIQPFIIGATYKYTLETTGSAEKEWRNGVTAKRTKELAAKGKLNSFSLAVGPTSAFRLKSSNYLKTKYAFAGEHNYKTTIELGAGYYWHKPDVQANIAYRTFKSTINAYGYHQNAKRTAITLEAYKFLFDFHGFVPFIGPSLSYESLTVNEKDGNNATATNTYKGIQPGITFGWDIRPNRIQSFLLRTNLRWQPNLNVTMNNGSKNALDQLEFNFIQLVIFPGRMKNK